MSKQSKKQTATEVENVVETTENEASEVATAQQAVESAQEVTKTVETQETQTQEVPKEQDVPTKPVKQEKQKSGGKGIAILALLVALGIGGAGYFFGNQKMLEVENQLKVLGQTVQSSVVQPSAVEVSSFEVEKAQIAKLTADYQQSQVKLAQLVQAQSVYLQQINALQQQLQKLGSTPQADQSQWIFADADFLLNNALRKMVLDNDIGTAKSLLIEADNVLSQLTDSAVIGIRDAIKADLNQLTSLNEVDQNNIMQRLAQLANLVDDIPLFEGREKAQANEGEVSDSLDDWQQNLEKSADSFLSHFIRVSDKNTANDKAFVAPNQEIYLRENIRLRLQIAILTVARQQNELYKQSLETVSSWVRSYFDVQNDNAKRFLAEVDDLIEQSIYVDAPNRLQSLTLLDEHLKKVPKKVVKIQLDEEKSLEQLKAEPAMEEKPAEEVEPAVEATERAQPQAEPANGQ